MFWISFQDTSGKNLAKTARQVAKHQYWSLTDVTSTEPEFEDPMTTLVFDNEVDRQAAAQILDQFAVLGRGVWAVDGE